MTEHAAPTDVRSGGGRLTRRRVLGGALAASGAAVAAACSPPSRVPVPSRRERRRVVVIGTGFGGSVTARRLAEAGVDVTLVERGRRWPAGVPGTFPTMFSPDRRVSWLSSTNSATGLVPNVPWRPYTGLLERIKGDGIDIVVAAAVGGGSLPYHGMSVQPRGDLFSRVMPGELDYDEFDTRWYPLVRSALGASPIPDDVLASPRYASSRAFIEAVRSAGFPEAQGEPMPIDWDVVRRELRGELPPNLSVGDVIYGVNGPGKRSLDTNYLPAAEATGRVELLALHQVRRIERDPQGRWLVPADRIDTDGVVREHVELLADALFLCAGSPNTTRLLVDAAGTGSVPDLPDDVGRWWSTNGDLVVLQILDHPNGRMQGGPASIASRDWDNPAGPMSLLFAPLPVPVDIGAMQTVAIFLPDGHGEFRYDARHGGARLSFPKSAHAASMDEARRRLATLGRAAGAVGSFDLTLAEPTTFHPLGGAVIGKVCDGFGRVLGQPGLYVNDGALIPGSTGCVNPSLTIAALAERNIDQVLRSDLGSVF